MTARFVVTPGSGIRGSVRVPGDKSISHRALILGCLAEGVTRVEGLLEGEDVKATAAACRQLGMAMRRDGQAWVLEGVGERGLQPPSAALDMGNSGTAMRLLAGVLAAQPFDSTLIGDESLSRRSNRMVFRRGFVPRRGFAITIGNVVSGAGDTSLPRRRRLVTDHEDVHVRTHETTVGIFRAHDDRFAAQVVRGVEQHRHPGRHGRIRHPAQQRTAACQASHEGLTQVGVAVGQTGQDEGRRRAPGPVV